MWDVNRYRRGTPADLVDRAVRLVLSPSGYDQPTMDEDVLGKAYDARLMRRLLQYLRPYWRQVLLALAAIVVGGFASLAQPYLIKIAIDRHIAAGALAGLDRLALVFLAVLMVGFAAEYVQTWTMQLTGQRIMFDLRMAVYGHLQRLDLRYYDRNPVGRLMTRVTSDVDVLNDLFTSGVVTAFGDVFMLVGIMVTMLWMNWQLALVAFAVLPLIVLVTQWFRRNVRESYRVVRGWIARINAFLQENITGMATVQLFRREPLNFARFDEIDRKHRDANIDSIFYYAVFYPAIEAIAAAGGGADHLVRRRQRPARHADPRRAGRVPAVLAAVLLADQRHVGEVQRAAVGHGLVRAHFQAARRARGDRVAGRPARRPPDAQGHIRFENVWFAYNDVRGDVDGSPTTDRRTGCSATSASRSVRASASASSARPAPARSTLINLLLRFYDVQRGRITIDGVDIRELDLGEVRGLVSLVLQDVHLFSGTIADNIRLGNAAIDDERMRRAARAVHAEPLHRAPAAGLCERGRRTRIDAVGRAEAAAVVRAGAGVRSARADPRRSDVERRHGNRAAHPRRAARADGRPHDDRDRAPAVDDPGHGQDPGAAQGPRARDRARIRSCSPSAGSTSSCSSCSINRT